MSQTLQQVQALVRAGKVESSRHGYRELAEDGILLDELVSDIDRAVVVEDYPAYTKGPCVLVLQFDSTGRPVHALWGIRAGETEPAVLVTAYRPDPQRWDAGFTRRLP